MAKLIRAFTIQQGKNLNSGSFGNKERAAPVYVLFAVLKIFLIMACYRLRSPVRLLSEQGLVDIADDIFGVFNPYG